MRELNVQEVKAVSGGLQMETGALAIIGLGLMGGPFTAAFGLTIGIGLLLG